MPTISVFEHESIFVGDIREDVSGCFTIHFEQKHFDSLADKLGKQDEKTFPFYSLAKDHHRDGIRFKQFVGVVQAMDLTIEILPKTDKGDEQYWKSVLLSMLCQVYNLNIRSVANSSQTLKRSSILDLFIMRFLDETERLCHTGLIKAYRKEDDNLHTLKGKLLLSKHLSKNVVHEELFYVKHTLYDRGHMMNRILRQTLLCISGSSTNSFLQQRALNYLDYFPELMPISVTEDMFSRLVYDRKSQDYQEAMTLSRLILFNNMPNLSSGHYNTLAILFDMNRLWEEFVYVTLRKNLHGYSVKAQERRSFWESPHRAIKPDIVIRKDKNLYILDTKWKTMEKAYPDDADLHQMYVYYKYFGADGVALVYPSLNQLSDFLKPGAFVDDNSGNNKRTPCDLLFLPVSDQPFKVKKWLNSIVCTVQDWLSSCLRFQ